MTAPNGNYQVPWQGNGRGVAPTYPGHLNPSGPCVARVLLTGATSGTSLGLPVGLSLAGRSLVGPPCVGDGVDRSTGASLLGYDSFRHAHRPTVSPDSPARLKAPHKPRSRNYQPCRTIWQSLCQAT